MPAITSRASMPAARTGSLPAARRNGVTEIASSGRTRAEPPMFVAAYWWTVHPGKEKQFRAAWRRGTELIRRKYGSLGSRLHSEERADGKARFVGIAEWPRSEEHKDEQQSLMSIT